MVGQDVIGTLPGRAFRFHASGGRTVSEAFAPREPATGEVVVEVAGSALGACPGREVSGRVVAAGEAAGDWLGRRVVVPRCLPCGECERCRRGHAARCDRSAPRGGVVTHETVPARFLLSVEPPLWPEGADLAVLAALADAAALPYGALVRAQLGPNELCAIVGGGIRGRFGAALARAGGAHAVVLESDPARRQAALGAGAHAVVDAADLDDAGVTRRLLSEAEALGLPPAEPKVIETTGTSAGRRRALALVAAGGTAVLCADGDGRDVRAPLEDLATGEAVVVGAAACHPDLYPELAALVVRGELPLGPAVRLFPMSAYAEALDGARSGRFIELPVLRPGASY